MTLGEYHKKRDFVKTGEPTGNDEREPVGKPIFVVQEHHATTHHFDFRLEVDGVLRSFAVPKGLPEEPGVRRLAIQTEDHPMDYAEFEGEIPEGQYGAGKVSIWDRGTYVKNKISSDELDVDLKGEKLRGRYVMVRFPKGGENSFLIFQGKEKK